MVGAEPLARSPLAEVPALAGCAHLTGLSLLPLCLWISWQAQRKGYCGRQKKQLGDVDVTVASSGPSIEVLVPTCWVYRAGPCSLALWIEAVRMEQQKEQEEEQAETHGERHGG